MNEDALLLIIAQVGLEPAVHCQASLKCMVAFHLSCAFENNIDCVLNEKGHPIFRCSFCLEMFKLKLIEAGSMSRFKQVMIFLFMISFIQGV